MLKNLICEVSTLNVKTKRIYHYYKDHGILKILSHCIPTKNIFVKQQANQQCIQTFQIF